MNNILLVIATIGISIVLIFLTIFLIILIQTLQIVKRVFLKLEIHLDTLTKDREELKLKILSFLEEFLLKIKKIFLRLEGGDSDAKKEKSKGE